MTYQDFVVCYTPKTAAFSRIFIASHSAPFAICASESEAARFGQSYADELAVQFAWIDQFHECASVVPVPKVASML